MKKRLAFYRRLLPVLPDYFFIRKQFRHTLGYDLNLSTPRTYSEKIQWLKLFWRPDVLSVCADKYAVRDFVAARAGTSLLNELYAVYNDPAEIDFAALPDQFVLKSTHSSGQIVLCTDKAQLDHAATRHQLKKWLESSHFYHAREWAYKNIRPRILCEKLLRQNGATPLDYKFHCFHGQPRVIHVDVDRFSDHKRSHYSLDWQPLELATDFPQANGWVERPAGLQQMLAAAALLSQGFPYVRVDFYQLDDCVVFGEMTFYPSGGYINFTPPEYAMLWGSWIKLPE